MIGFRLTCQHLFVLFAALSLMLTGSLSMSTGQAAASTNSFVISATSIAAKQGSVTIKGSGFFPGGDVYIALYDQWGARLHETRWVKASATIYGQNGSADPAMGYVAGGTFAEAFAIPCGATVMTRAFDQATVAWSGLIDVDHVTSACPPSRREDRRTPA